MSVVLDPSSTLGFTRPLTTHVKRTLTIKNPNAQPVAFKVKTTAPKLYCVRPNSGRVEPGESVEVQVMLQAMKEEPPLAAKCKDKFLIQSTLITPEKETLPLQDIWSSEAGEEVHSQKIRVAYLPPEGQTVPEEDEGHSQQAIDPLPVQPSGLEHYNTTAQFPENGHAPIPEFIVHDDSHELHRSDPEVHVDAPSTPPPDVSVQHEELPPQEFPTLEEPPAVVNVNVHTPAPAPPPPAPIAAPVPPPVDPNPELVYKLQDAQAEIQRLRDLISSMPDPSSVASNSVVSGTATELRRRTRTVSDDGSTLSPETDVSSYVDDRVMQPDGVPLQVVIIVALGVFITTYLFF